MALTKQRFFLWLATACFVLVVGVLLALPWVYAWAVPYLLERQGMAISDTTHHPLRTLRLEGIRYKDPQAGLNLSVQSIELPAFYPLLIGALSTGASKSAVTVTDWRLDLAAPEDAAKSAVKENTEDTPEPALSAAAQVMQVRDLLHSAAPWLARIEVRNGQITYDEYTLSLPLVRWQDGTLDAKGSLPAQAGDFTLQLSRLNLPSPGLVATIELEKPGISGELRALVPYLENDVLNASLSLQWKGGLCEANARWEGQSLVPASADLTVSDFPIPADFVVIPNYAQPLVSAQAAWQQRSGSLRLRGHAESLTPDSPPLDWSLQAGIDTRGIEINALQMNGPWLNGELGEPIQLEWAQLFTPEHRHPQQTEDAQAAEPTLRLVLDMNLADFPLIPLEGRASGMLGLSTDATGRAQADLSLQSHDLSWRNIRLQSLRLQASLRGSVVRLVEMDIRADDGSYLSGSGGTDLATRSVDKAQFKGNITDRFVLALGSALPQGENAEFVVELYGPWLDLSHAGQIRLNKIRQSSAGDHFDATLQWQGKGQNLPDIDLSAFGEQIEAKIEAAFIRDEQTRMDRLTLQSAYLRAGKYPAITLEEPSVLTFYEVDNTLELTPLKLSSDGEGYLHAHITLPQGDTWGLISLHAAQISGRWLEIYRGAQLPCPIGIDTINADFQWRGNEWLRGTFALRAHAEPAGLPPIQFNAEAMLDPTGIHAGQISASDADNPLLSLAADLPLAVKLDERHRASLHLLAKEPLNAKGELVLDNPGLAAWLEETFTLHLGALSASLTLEGTPLAPTGTASLSLGSFSWQQPPAGLPPLPRIDNLRIQGAISPEQITLHSLEAQLADIPLTASAQLPFTAKDRRRLFREGGIPALDKASGTLSSGDIPLRELGPALPGMLRPMGQISIRAQLQPGLDLSGVFELREASTRPLPPIGSIDNINAQIHLKDRRLSIGQLDAQIGAQPVTIEGSVTLSDSQAIICDLSLRGGDLPIVRSPGLILRAKPDITLKTGEDGTTVLGGTLDLGQSFYTIDFASLTAPGGGGADSGGANNRPPYFSVSEPPMSRWQLNLRLRGDNFLRIRTPAFEGIASANFNLRGPLVSPFAFGSAEIDQGVVMFPYATLRVRSGGLSIRQDDPYTGRLDMTATGRAYGYDLTMHLTGTINDPNIQFDASPSLDQAEILMLLTTGQIPNAPERSAMSRLSGLGMFLGNSVLINLGLVDPLDDRFELLIGEDVTEKDQDTITVRYRLTDDWSIIGNYDRFDAYNLDLQWTIYRD